MEGPHILGALQESMRHLHINQRRLEDKLDAIHETLRSRTIKPPLPSPSLDWTKWAPRIWWTLLAVGLVAAKMYDLPEVATILTKLA